jgi:signal peptidase II
MVTILQKIKISKKTVLFIILAVFFVVVDRFLKFLCLQDYFDRPLPLLGNFFSLEFVKNYYISFSIPLSGPILTALIGIIIIILLIYLIKPFFSSNFQFPISNFQISLTILIIGAILNFTDRIKFGYVIDYFSLKYFTVFNLADIMIVSSVIWLIILNNHKKI